LQTQPRARFRSAASRAMADGAAPADISSNVSAPVWARLPAGNSPAAAFSSIVRRWGPDLPGAGKSRCHSLRCQIGRRGSR
jgi:hypothetical protein